MGKLARRTRISKSLMALLLLGLITVQCARNPATGKREVVLMSEAQEIAYGRQADPQIQAELGQVESETLPILRR